MVRGERVLPRCKHCFWLGETINTRQKSLCSNRFKKPVAPKKIPYRRVDMKVNFDIECTPEEARRFLGLPDLGPMQERMMKEIEERMAENLRALDPETLVKTWMPMTMQGWGEMQKMFWSQMGVKIPENDSKAKSKTK